MWCVGLEYFENNGSCSLKGSWNGQAEENEGIIIYDCDQEEVNMVNVAQEVVEEIDEEQLIASEMEVTV